MESNIIAEGFKQLIDMHNLIYSRFIVDGDSSTYMEILELKPYKDMTKKSNLNVPIRSQIHSNTPDIKLYSTRQPSTYSIKPTH